MPMDQRHPGPHLTREGARLLAKLTRHGIDPARLSRHERPDDAGPPPSTTELQAALAPHAAVQQLPNGLAVVGLDAEQVGAHAFAAGIPLSALATTASGLEDVFLSLVTGEHTTTATEGAGR